MNLGPFTQEQRQVLLELLILAMYADGHLASAEDAKLLQVAREAGFDSDYARDHFLDQVFTRVTRLVRTPEVLRAHAAALGRSYPSSELKRLACSAVAELLASDSAVSSGESQFLGLVRESFGL